MLLRRCFAFATRSVSSQATRATRGLSLRKATETDINYVLDLYKRQGISGGTPLANPNDVERHLDYLFEFRPHTDPGYIIESTPSRSNKEKEGTCCGYIGSDVWHLGFLDGIVRPEESGYVNYMELILEPSMPDQEVALEALSQFQGMALRRAPSYPYCSDIKVIRTQVRSTDVILKRVLQRGGFHQLSFDPLHDQFGELGGSALFEKYNWDPMEHFDWLNPAYSYLQADLDDDAQ